MIGRLKWHCSFWLLSLWARSGRHGWHDFLRASRWCWISSRHILASKKLFLREKWTEKARCICHTRHSTCSHVDLVVLGVSQHSSLSVLFSVAPPNKCRFGDGKRRVTFHQWLFPYIFCVCVYTKLRNISMRQCTWYLCLSFVKSICNCYPQTLRDFAMFKNDEKSRKQAGYEYKWYSIIVQNNIFILIV